MCTFKIRGNCYYLPPLVNTGLLTLVINPKVNAIDIKFIKVTWVHVWKGDEKVKFIVRDVWSVNELPKTHVFQGITKRMAHLYKTFLNQTKLLPPNRRHRGQHCRQGRKSSFSLPFSNMGAYQRVLYWHFSVIVGCSGWVKLSAITFKKMLCFPRFSFYFIFSLYLESGKNTLSNTRPPLGLPSWQ